MKLSPIILFVYNRPDHTLKTLKSLQENELADQSELIIYSDGPKENASQEVLEKIKEVRRIIRSENWCSKVSIQESPVNKGLAKSIIHGVTETLNSHDRVIVLEDDMITSKYFLRYMNEGLNLYADEDKVISITGYQYPVKSKLPETFFLKGTFCWGWSTWKRGWKYFNSDAKWLLNQIENKNLSYELDFYGTHHYTRMLRDQAEGKIDSWALPWYAAAFLEDKLTLLPGTSLVQNIGLDGSGIHKDNTENYHVKLKDKPVVLQRINCDENAAAKRMIADTFESIKKKNTQKKGIKIRLLSRLKKKFKRAT